MLYPKIGIRPTIDGRWGGIREGLEEQTMGLAHAAKALMETLRYLDGTPVQVVISPCLQIAEGTTATLPDEVHAPLDLRTDPTWPTTWFVPNLTGEGAFKDVYSVMANRGANHGVTVYGHVGADLINLASMLRIPVTMHNIPADKVYRPHSWAAFGTQDTQAADYAACKHYGPLYGKL